MDAVEFVKQLRRMDCQYHRKFSLFDACNTPEQVVEEVEKWAKEHPVKTRQSEFLEHYPNAAMRKNGALLCPKAVDDTHTPASGKCRPGGGNCLECMEEYWLAEVEEK